MRGHYTFNRYAKSNQADGEMPVGMDFHLNHSR